MVVRAPKQRLVALAFALCFLLVWRQLDKMSAEA